MKTVSVDKTDSDNPNCFPRSTNPGLRARSTLRIGKPVSPDTWLASPKSELKRHTIAQRSDPSKWLLPSQKTASQFFPFFQPCSLSNSHNSPFLKTNHFVLWILYAWFYFLSTLYYIQLLPLKKIEILPPESNFPDGSMAYRYLLLKDVN